MVKNKYIYLFFFLFCRKGNKTTLLCAFALEAAAPAAAKSRQPYPTLCEPIDSSNNVQILFKACSLISGLLQARSLHCEKEDIWP